MAPSENPLGNPIPAFTEHAISVSLPTWADNVGYEEGEARVVDAMQTGYPRFFISLNIRKVSGCFFFTSAAPHSANFFFVMLHVAFCPLRTKVRHTFRELPTNPLPQIRRGVPRIPSRTRRPRARRAALHLRPPLHLPGAVPSGQGQHCQAILAAHRSRHLEPASYAVPHCPRTRLVTHVLDFPASQARRAPALRLLQTGTRTVV